MSRVGDRLIVWRGGEHVFNLSALGDRLALEDKCGSGLGAIYRRLADGTWKLYDVREPIRLGLIGGGCTPEQATELVHNCVDLNPRGLAPSVVLALAVVESVLIGVPDDVVGKKKAKRAAPRSTTKTGVSAAPRSSEPARR